MSNTYFNEVIEHYILIFYAYIMLNESGTVFEYMQCTHLEGFLAHLYLSKEPYIR